MTSTVKDRLEALRAYLEENGMEAWVAPTADPHLSEYIDEHYAFRKWLSGFTGSAGALIVTRQKAFLLTDSRYWAQAEKELEGTEIQLVKQQDKLFPEIGRILAANVPPSSMTGMCGCYLSASQAEALCEPIRKARIYMQLSDRDAADVVWKDRPAKTANPIYEHIESPRTRRQKIRQLKALMKERDADDFFTSRLDNIAWLLNLRGSDIACNPVFYAFLLVPAKGKIKLFADKSRFDEALTEKLERENIVILPYQTAEYALRLESSRRKPRKLLIDPDEINYSTLLHVTDPARLIKESNPLEALKAIKTPKEIALIEQAMVKDGAALCRFYAWFDEHRAQKPSETEVAEKLLAFRRECEGFVSLSFETISAFGENAALPHYQPSAEKDKRIEGNGFLLIDSGAQFPQGTTDITRTTLIGEASEAMRRDYTAVLRAHIRLAKSVFPLGISSQVIDVIARAPIWEGFADFGHGTGHGVGFFLNVHEGPQRISYPRIAEGMDAMISYKTAMQAGMVTSNEPGLYRPGKWGIRIENLVATVDAAQNEFGRFLKFKTLTLCPIDLSALNADQLLADEKDWLNRYHAAVRRKLLPHLDSKTAEWLKRKTKGI